MEPQDFSFSARSPWSICRILELDETEDDALNQMRPINFAATWHCSNAATAVRRLQERIGGRIGGQELEQERIGPAGIPH